ncbi:MAG: hypothetical protein AB6733_23415 [Clostridiaceae bacterium]
MCRLYLGQGMEREVFKELFINHIEDKYKRKEFKSLRIIWDYDISELDVASLTFSVIKPEFSNIRCLEEGKLPIKVDLLFIDEFYKTPQKIQFKILNKIREGKFDSMLFILDKKINVDKYDDDFLDLIKHYNVRAKSP